MSIKDSISAKSIVFPNFYLDLALSILNNKKINSSEYLISLGLDQEIVNKKNSVLTAEQFKKFFNACIDNISKDKPAFIQLIKYLPLTAHGLIGLASITAPTVSEALDIGINYFALLLPTYKLQRETIGSNTYVFVSHAYNFGSPYDEILTELVIANFAHIAEFSNKRKIEGDKVFRHIEVHLKHHRDKDLEEYNSYFGEQITFGSYKDYFVIRNIFLNQSLSTSSATVHTSLVHQLDLQLNSLTQMQKFSLRVKSLVSDALIKGEIISLDLIANKLILSSRTLTRYLKYENENFNNIVTEVKIERAESLLLHSNFPLIKIAQLSGFSSHTTFTRSFKTTTKITPSEFRKKYCILKVATS